MRPEELSRQLRQGSGEFLARRRKIVGLALTAAGSMGLISLYQMGIIKHLPEPPLPRFDADKVDAAAEAYAKLSTPDAVIGLGNYAATLGLAAMGGQDRATERPWIPLALAAKVAFDAVQAGNSAWTSGRSTGRSASGACWPPAPPSPRCRSSSRRHAPPYANSLHRGL